MMVFAFFLLCLLTISSVSATRDTSTEDIVTDDNNQITQTNTVEPTDTNVGDTKTDTPKTSIKTDNDKLSKSNDKTNLKGDTETTKSFTELNNSIQGNLSKHEIKLEHNYTYTDIEGADLKKGITIDGNQFTDENKTFTINGNGYTLNGNGEARIFTVINNAQLIIKNLKITRGQGQNEGSSGNVGGAIYINNATVTIIDCIITQNNCTYRGGAIYSEYSNLKVSGTTFINNTAPNFGGAICNYYESTITIIESIFTGNEGRTGGAIYNNGNATITGSKFTQNNATNSGGAIYTNMDKTTTIINSTFTQNTADNNGGAIGSASKSKLNITRSNFTENTAENLGGAIYNTGNATIIESTFTKNNATKCGGAIFNYVANDYEFISGFMNITQGTFIENTAKDLGGAIANSNNGFMKINKSTFTKNNATNSGGAIYAESYSKKSSKVEINYSLFQKNNATNGEDIYITYKNTVVTGSKNAFVDQADILRNTGTLTLNYDVIRDDSFAKLYYTIITSSNNTITLDQNYKYYSTSSDGYDNDSEFVTGIPINKTITINGNGHTIDAQSSSRIFLVNSNVNLTIENLNLNNSKQDSEAIYLKNGSSVTIINSNFTDTLNIEKDSAITTENDTTLTIIGSIFTGTNIGITVNKNSVVNIINSNFKEQGGTIVALKSIVNITNSNFILTLAPVDALESEVNIKNTTFTKTALAINTGYGLVNIEDCNFIEVEGGITSLNDTVNITNTNFTGKLIPEILMINIINSTANITNCNFKDVIDAIYASNSTANITNCNFIGNITITKEQYKIKPDLLTIESIQSKINIKDSNFIENALAVNAIYSEVHISGNKTLFAHNIQPINIFNSTLTIDSAKFAKNLDLAGTIAADNTSINIKNAIFEENEATLAGAAIAVTNSNLTVTNTTFLYNSAKKLIIGSDGGAIAALNHCNITITGSAFIENTADKDGGAIYEKDNDNVIINNNIFLNNMGSNQESNQIYSKSTNSNFDSNWFGNTADNYTNNPSIGVNLNNWLFLNATINSDPNNILSTKNITFKLYQYNESATTNKISEYNNNLIYPIDLRVNCINGTLDKNNTKLEDKIIYTPKLGTDNITANIGHIKYTIKLTNKYTTTFTINNIPDFTEGSNIELIVNEKNNYTGPVIIIIGSETYTIHMVNGIGKLTIKPKLVPGTYTAKIVFAGNENYTNTTASSNKFTIKKQNTKIIAKNKVYKPSKYRTYTVTVKNRKGKLVSKTKVKLTIGKKTYTAKTNKKGIATFKILNKKSKKKSKKSKKKSYKITATLNKNAKKDKLTLKMGSKTYNTKTNNKGKATFKVKTNTKKIRKYTITLKTTNGQSVKKQKVTLKVNKKTFKATTNTKGKATFKINNLNKNGKYKAKINYKGNNNYNKSSKTVKLTVKE